MGEIFFWMDFEVRSTQVDNTVPREFFDSTKLIMNNWVDKT